MKRLKYIFLALLIASLGLSACDLVHEFPEAGGEIDPTDISTGVEIICEMELNVERIVTKGTPSPVYSDEDRAKYTRRYTVSILDESRDEHETVYENIFYQEVDDCSPLQFTTSLHAKKYNILVWMDYVLKDNREDLYYNTASGMTRITVRDREHYTADDDFKDAQTVLYPVDLTGSKEWFQHIEIVRPLHRPVAKLSFEATDIEEYAKKMGYEGPLEELLNNYSVRVLYNGYLATGFNAVSQKMNDSSVGYIFTSCPRMSDKPGISVLGFDYVFVNGEESSVTVTVEISNRDGKIINCVDGIVVPTYRGKETIVRMKFFTKEYYPGIGINPAFDGEFNVYVL